MRRRSKKGTYLLQRIEVQARGRKPRAGLRAGAIEEPTLAVVGITRRTMVFASKQELASLDKKNELCFFPLLLIILAESNFNGTGTQVFGTVRYSVLGILVMANADGVRGVSGRNCSAVCCVPPRDFKSHGQDCELVQSRSRHLRWSG